MSAPVADGVREEPRVPLHAPAAGVVPEVGDHEADCVEDASRERTGHVHTGIAEPDDVRAAVAGGVGEEPRVPLDAPAAGVVPEEGTTSSTGPNEPSASARER
jgi:hypothetical protein